MRRITIRENLKDQEWSKGQA